MFTPRADGGLGLFYPRINYHCKKLSFFLSVLNNDDLQTRFTARESLKLHLTKRKCELTDDPEENFSGYSVDNNYNLIKKSKVTWRRSIWIHLNELCSRLSTKLHIRGDEYVLRVTDDAIELSFSDAKAFHSSFKRLQLRKMLALWKEKEFQGRIARTPNVDSKVSSPHLANLKLDDALVKFVVKARLQLIETNTVMHTYYPAECHRSCDRCGFHSDTLSHVLNGCPESSDAIQSRHNRVVNVIAKTLTDESARFSVTVDSPVKPAMFLSPEPDFTGIRHNRPDICMISHEHMKCYLIEVAIPFDPFINDSYQSKFERYLPLCQRINDLGYECKIAVCIIGSVGNVHNKFISGLRLVGLTAARARALAKYCSISVVVGSRIIWRQRCSHVLQ